MFFMIYIGYILLLLYIIYFISFCICACITIIKENSYSIMTYLPLRQRCNNENIHFDIINNELSPINEI